MTRLLLDSIIVIRFMNGDCEEYRRFADADAIYFSPVVLGECLAGLRDNRRDRNRREKLFRILSLPNVSIPALTAATADRYARLWQFLSDSGHRIPANDIWIAAHALELSATLVTADRHFSAIPTLPLLLEGD